MASIINTLDFFRFEHTWFVRLPFEEYDAMTEAQKDQFTDALRKLRDSLGVEKIEASGNVERIDEAE